MYDGIVLAGGFSSRFKQNKMCVEYLGKALILHTVCTMLKICDRVYVVTGHYHHEITKVLEGYDKVEVIFNKGYSEGMFSSVKLGVHHVNHDFFIIPGDYPLVNESTYKKLLLGSKDLRVPSYNMHLGHPLFISYSLKNSLLNTENTSLKDFRNQIGYEIIEVEDEYIHLDIDTINDFSKIKERND